MSDRDTDTIVIRTNKGPLVIETTDSSLSSNDVSVIDCETSTTAVVHGNNGSSHTGDDVTTMSFAEKLATSLPPSEVVTISAVFEYIRELATMHTVSLRCCEEEALIVVEDSYINTNVLTDLVATSSDVSFSTAIAGSGDTIEVTVSITGDTLEQFVTAKKLIELPVAKIR